jgi:hypothetical protein
LNTGIARRDGQTSLTELRGDPLGGVEERETAVDTVRQLTTLGKLLDPQIAVKLDETSGRLVEDLLVARQAGVPEAVELEVESSLAASGQLGLGLGTFVKTTIRCSRKSARPGRGR